ncbi:MAG: hypothetical protein PHQ22_09930 [Sulfuricurvum sp.]|nr:hypothetical protein [Sulfuricurvum sp.]MDD5387497.1 hypothetical protein [Sulfuricurvum sp.]
MKTEAKIFSEAMARELIEQIELATTGNPKGYDMVVHCRASVATFIALNEIYNLN